MNQDFCSCIALRFPQTVWRVGGAWFLFSKWHPDRKESQLEKICKGFYCIVLSLITPSWGRFFSIHFLLSLMWNLFHSEGLFIYLNMKNGHLQELHGSSLSGSYIYPTTSFHKCIIDVTPSATVCRSSYELRHLGSSPPKHSFLEKLTLCILPTEKVQLFINNRLPHCFIDGALPLRPIHLGYTVSMFWFCIFVFPHFQPQLLRSRSRKQIPMRALQSRHRVPLSPSRSCPLQRDPYWTKATPPRALTRAKTALALPWPNCDTTDAQHILPGHQLCDKSLRFFHSHVYYICLVDLCCCLFHLSFAVSTSLCLQVDSQCESSLSWEIKCEVVCFHICSFDIALLPLCFKSEQDCIDPQNIYTFFQCCS